ncbi:hypothetical protein I317_05544 [Kwoniella heveanensis CBS 569]|nr:hypothetical protein I317_05544 [Kwoniella heveanensis CBS 569]
MPGLQLDNATPPPLFAPVPVPVQAGSKASLPSFDDLMKSLDLSSSSSSSLNNGHHHSPHHHHHSHHAAHPYPYPHHSPNAHHHIMFHRPPSTPPTPSSDEAHIQSERYENSQHEHRSAKHVHHKGRHAGRPRSSSVPPISKTHLSSPFRDLHGLSPSPHGNGDHEHHASRIQSLKEGDGEWAPYSLNAVAPSSLPYATPSLPALPPPLARSTTLPSKGIDRINPNPVSLSGPGSSYADDHCWRKQSFVLPLPFADDCSDTEDDSEHQQRQQMLLTPPPSPPLLPVPLPDDGVCSAFPHSFNDYIINSDKCGDTYPHPTASPTHIKPVPLTSQHIGASHSAIDSGNVRGRGQKRRYGDADGVGSRHQHGYGYRYEAGIDSDTDSTPQTGLGASHAPNGSARLWHWTESPPQWQLTTPLPRPSSGARISIRSSSVSDGTATGRYGQQEENAFVAESILRHLLKIGEKRSWSMI